MDPNANLERQLELARDTLAQADEDGLRGESPEDAGSPGIELAEYVVALHGWIVAGGFLPEQWEEARNRAIVPKQLQGERLLRLIEQRGAPTVVRQNGPTDWMMANYVLVTFADGFECGIAPDGAVSS